MQHFLDLPDDVLTLLIQRLHGEDLSACLLLQTTCRRLLELGRCGFRANVVHQPVSVDALWAGIRLLGSATDLLIECTPSVDASWFLCAERPPSRHVLHLRLHRVPQLDDEFLLNLVTAFPSLQSLEVVMFESDRFAEAQCAYNDEQQPQHMRATPAGVARALHWLTALHSLTVRIPVNPALADNFLLALLSGPPCLIHLTAQLCPVARSICIGADALRADRVLALQSLCLIGMEIAQGPGTGADDACIGPATAAGVATAQEDAFWAQLCATCPQLCSLELPCALPASTAVRAAVECLPLRRLVLRRACAISHLPALPQLEALGMDREITCWNQDADRLMAPLWTQAPHVHTLILRHSDLHAWSPLEHLRELHVYHLCLGAAAAGRLAGTLEVLRTHWLEIDAFSWSKREPSALYFPRLRVLFARTVCADLTLCLPAVEHLKLLRDMHPTQRRLGPDPAQATATAAPLRTLITDDLQLALTAVQARQLAPAHRFKLVLGGSETPPTPRDLATVLPLVTDLRLDSCTSELLSGLSGASALRRLELTAPSDLHWAERLADALATARPRHLRTLALFDCLTLEERVLRRLLAAVGPRVHSLTVQDAPLLGDPALAQVAAHCPELERAVLLRWGSLRGEAVVALVQQCPALGRLNVDREVCEPVLERLQSVRPTLALLLWG